MSQKNEASLKALREAQALLKKAFDVMKSEDAPQEDQKLRLRYLTLAASIQELNVRSIRLLQKIGKQ